MAIKFNVGFGERITSAGINEKIASLAGKNFKIEGFEARFTGQYEVTVGPGKCVVQGTIIESDADMVVEIPAELRGYNNLALTGDYNHELRTFELVLERQHYNIDNLIPIANIDVISRGCENIDYNLQINELMELMDNPDKIEYRTFSSENNEEIVFDTVPHIGGCQSDYDGVLQGVVRNGLLAQRSAPLQSPFLTGMVVPGEYTAMMTMDMLKMTKGAYLFGDFKSNTGITFSIAPTTMRVTTYVGEEGGSVNEAFSIAHLDKTEPILVSFLKNESGFILRFNDFEYTYIYKRPLIESGLQFTFGTFPGAANSELEGCFKNCILYNRTLSENEITHNLNVLSKANENTAVDASDVSGGIVNAKIKGQTIKNYARTTRTLTASTETGWRNKVTRVDRDLLSPSTKYYVHVYVFKNTLNGKFMVSQDHQFNLDSLFVTQKLIDPGFTGYARFEVTTLSDLSTPTANAGIVSQMATISTTGEIEYATMLTDTDIDLRHEIKHFIPFGLNSAQAIITHNDKQYPIYKPTIQGQTRVMRATKGGSDWVETIPMSARDTAKYDYKLVNNNDLGSVPSGAYDYIDRIKKNKVVHTREKYLKDLITEVYDANSSVTIFRILYTDLDNATTGFYQGQSAKLLSTIDIISGVGIGQLSTEHIGKLSISSAGTRIDIPFEKGTSLEGAKTKLGTAKIRYQLTSPIETPMTDKEIAEYDQYMEVIDLGMVEGAMDTLEVDEYGNGIWVRNTSLQTIQYLTHTSSQDGINRYAYALTEAGKPDKRPISECINFNFSYDSFWNEHYYVDGSLIIYTSKTHEEIKSILLGTKLRYQLATPVTTIIPKELMPKITLATGTSVQTNRIKLDSAVAGKFTLTVPTTPNDGFRDLRNMMLAQKAELESGRTSVITGDGEEIVINQGPETGSAAIAKIAGQTVRNYISGNIWIQNDACDTTEHTITLGGTSTSRSGGIMIPISKLSVGKKYALVYEVISNDQYKGNFKGDAYHTYPCDKIYPLDMNPGLHVQEFTCKEYTVDIFKISTDCPADSGSLVVSRNFIIVDAEHALFIQSPSKKIGCISSTQATLTAKTDNGTVTTNIYEPTIKGETKIVDANGNECAAGTSGARLVSLESTDSSLPALGHVGNVYDEIDIVNKVLIKRTNEILLSERAWIQSGSLLAHTGISDANPSNASAIFGVCDTIPYTYYNNPSRTSCFVFHTNKNLEYLYASNETLDTFKVTLASKNPRFRYILGNPQIIPLTDEQIQSYMHHCKVIELNKVGDVADELVVNEDGSGTWIKRVDNVFDYQLSTWGIAGEFSPNPDVFAIYSVFSDKFVPYRYEESVCDKLSYLPQAQAQIANRQLYTINSQRTLVVCLSKTTAPDMSSAVHWINDERPVLLKCLSSPITTYIPKELMPQVPLALTNGRNELIAGGAIKPSALEINRIHGDKAIEKTDAEARKIYSEIEAKTNGLARIVGGKIEGRTVKNILPCDTVFNKVRNTCDVRFDVKLQDTLRKDRKYIAIVDIDTDCTENKFYMSFQPTQVGSSGWDLYSKAVTPGINYLEFYPINDSDYLYAIGQNSTTWSSGFRLGARVITIIPADMADNNLESERLLPGLNSSKTIISNGEFEARVYNPIITGETRIMKATKGTQNWVEISPAESRDTVKYDYKLVNVDDLGSVSTVYDYIDLARKVKVVNTKEVVLNGSENWIDGGNITSGTFNVKVLLPDSAPAAQLPTVICDVSKSNTQQYGVDEEACTIYAESYFAIKLLKTKVSSVQAFKEYIAKNPITIRYQLAAPIEVSLTDDEIAQYSQYKEVIELNKISDYTDSIEFSSNGAIWRKTLSKQVILSGSDGEITTHRPAINGLSGYRFDIPCADTAITDNGPSLNGKWVADKLMPVDWLPYYDNGLAGFCLGRYSGTGFTLYSRSASHESLREYIDNISPITCIYPVKEQVIYIPPEFIEYLPVHRGKNELTAGGAVKANIVENLQLEFNDNIYDKAPIPTIKNDKITGLYLPEIKRHFDLGFEQPVVSNPNLLINGDFRVNQRGESTYQIVPSAYKYTADRWITYTASSEYGEITPLPNGGVTGKATTSGAYIRMRQKIDPNISRPLRGKVVTFSVCLKNVHESLHINILKNSDASSFASKIFKDVTGIVSFTFTVPQETDILQVQFSVPYPYSMNIAYAKLELGDVATPLQPRLYDEELVLCKRYFHKTVLRTIKTSVAKYAQPVSGSDFPCPMRVAPSWNVRTGNYYDVTGNNSAGHPALSQIFWNEGITGIELVAFAGALSIDITKMYLDLDAEIY